MTQHMTHTQMVTYPLFLALALALTGLHSVHASEVTGTLSSDPTEAEGSASGSIGGTVTSEDSTNRSSSRGGGSSSTRVGSGGSSATDTPAGTVLGAAAASTQVPGFPNAGSAPTDPSLGEAIWSNVTTFITNLLPFSFSSENK